MYSQEELSGGEPEVQRAPLVVAVVPALPRGAAVELHVTAVRDAPEERTSCHMTTELACGSIECWGLVSSTSRCATTPGLYLWLTCEWDERLNFPETEPLIG